VQRVFVLCHKYYDGKAPAAGERLDMDVALWSAVHGSVEEVAKHIDHFRLRDALGSAMNVARAGNKYLSDNEPWKLEKTDPERTRTILANSLNVAAVLSIVLEPFLPHTTAKLRRMLGIGVLPWDDAFRSELIGEGVPLGKPEHLFKPITDAEIQPEIERLHASDQTIGRSDTSTSLSAGDQKMESPAPAVAAAKPNIAFDDFAKLDLRVGTIVAAERVPKADKLLKLAIDIGEPQPRTVVSGIAMHYAPEQLPGQQVVLVANLEPRKMRGVESQGMVLMAEDPAGKLVFVQPKEAIGPGAEVR
jgi:methionyl-tRNA synthetase